jgi:lysophospholipase L1-like esterase
MMRRRFLLVGAAAIASVTLQLGSHIFARERQTAPEKWVTGWGTSQQTLGMTAISNATVRMIARVTIPGEAVRIRLDNTYGTAPVTVGKAFVGWRRAGATIFPGSNRPVQFHGSAEVTIPPGGSAVSDSVPLRVLATQDLAVSLYIPGAGVRPSQHGNSVVTSFMTADNAGDASADETPNAFTNKTTAGLWLKSIDVQSPTATGAVVAFGDSITEGTCATLDGADRWPDWLALRLDLDGRRMAVINEGIGGNTVLAKHPDPIPPAGMAGMERLERDVLSHQGLTHVILFIGTNDLRRSATAAMVRDGLQDVIKRVKARGIKIYGATIVPRHNNQQIPWDPAKTKQRNELNDWIRTKAPYDAVLDFDKIARDPSNPDLLNPPFDCDGIHPNPLGYYEMAKSIRLDLFGRPGRGATR